MNVPKWLLPGVAIVAALAVGAAALLIGMRFAPPTPASAFVAPQTETATVLAPVAAVPVVPDANDDTALAPESPAVGEREVAVEETDPAATDGELLRLIDLIGLSPDLLAGLMSLGAGERDDDPCAPRSDAPGEDCPTGFAGVVLYDHELPPLWMNAQAWPRPHAELRDLPPRDLGELMCDPPDVPEGAASLRIRATAPGAWTVRYWESDRPGDVRITEAVVSGAQQVDDWTVEAGRDGDGFYIAEHCILLPDLEPGTAYTAVISGDDVFGRTPADFTVHFNADGSPQHPSLSVQTIGQNLLLATVPHAADQTVHLQSLLVGPETDASCTQPEGATYLPALTEVDHVAVGESERYRLNVTDDVTEKSVVSFRVPEGATLLLCARWYPGGGAPSWESEQASYESSMIVQAADRLLPKVEFTRFDARDGRSVALALRVDTAEGLRCGATEWGSGNPVGAVLCAPSALAGGTAGTESDRLFDRGFTGDLVLRVDGTISSGETSETTYLLPAGEGACTGVCEAPYLQTYRVATIGGTATVRVSWEQGLQNGQTTWRVTDAVSRPIDYVMPDVPQIEVGAGWDFSTPTFSPTVTADLRIAVDRPVTWTLTTIDASTGDQGMTCGPAPRPLTASGSSSDGFIDINLFGVCLGGSYAASLRLVDDTGAVAVWDVTRRDTWWRTGAFMTAPRLDVTVRYRVDVFTSGSKFLRAYNLWFNGTYPLVNDDADPVGTPCVAEGGVVKSEGTFDSVLGSSADVGAEVVIVDRAFGDSGACLGETGGERSGPAIAQIPIALLASPEGVLLETSDPTVRVHIWVTRR